MRTHLVGRAFAGLIQLSIAAAFSCGSDAQQEECIGAVCDPACLEVVGPTCDILTEACRQRIFTAVTCVRGEQGGSVDVRAITVEQYRQEVLDAQRAGSDAGVEDVEQKPPVDPWSTALRLLGLIEIEQSDVGASLESSASYLAGYYDADRRAITLIDRGAPMEDRAANAILAHEYVHALQDQTNGLNELARRLTGSVDANYARSCLTEGEANLYEELAMALLQGTHPEPTGWRNALASDLKRARRRVGASNSPYADLWLLRYPVGTRYLLDVWLEAGNAGVQAQYWNLKPSTIYWMHTASETAALSMPLLLPLTCSAATAPADLALELTTSVGPFSLFAFLATQLRDAGLLLSAQHWETALAWRQDALTVYAGRADEVAVTWRVRFDDPERAHAVAAALWATESAQLRVSYDDREVEIRAATEDGIFDAWPWTDSAACPDPVAD